MLKCDPLYLPISNERGRWCPQSREHLLLAVTRSQVAVTFHLSLEWFVFLNDFQHQVSFHKLISPLHSDKWLASTMGQHGGFAEGHVAFRGWATEIGHHWQPLRYIPRRTAELCSNFKLGKFSFYCYTRILFQDTGLSLKTWFTKSFSELRLRVLSHWNTSVHCNVVKPPAFSSVSVFSRSYISC